MTHFSPCKDRNACTEGGAICRGCGRTHEEIASFRAIVAQVAEFVSKIDLDNPEDFLNYLTRKVLKKTKRKKPTAGVGMQGTKS
jgi:predicted Fe-S protein YdhL (DUF1289 family)